MTSGSECGWASTLLMTGILGVLMVVEARASLQIENPCGISDLMRAFVDKYAACTGICRIFAVLTESL